MVRFLNKKNYISFFNCALYFLSVLIFLGLCFSTSLKSSDDPLVKLRFQGGIPRPVSSRLFIYSFNGEMCGQFSGTFHLFGNFYGGVGYLYSQMVNSKQFRDPLSSHIFVRLNSHLAGVRLSYDYVISKNSRWNFSLLGGFGYNEYINRKFSDKDTLIPSPVFTCGWTQPEISYEYLIDNHLCFSFGLGYSVLFDRFNARQSSLEKFYNTSMLKKYGANSFYISWINFSFGCTVYLGKVRN
jgi:hypothetical protein